MTKDEILNMPAGRELDALVAEHVMEWTEVSRYQYASRKMSNNEWTINHEDWRGNKPARDVYEEIEQQFNPPPSLQIKNYSTNIAAAWEVVEAICIPAPEGCWTGPEVTLSRDGATVIWQVFFDYLDSLDGVHPNYNGAQTSEAEAETAPLAICRAALLAVMELDE